LQENANWEGLKPVIIVLKNQPSYQISSTIKKNHDAKLEELSSMAREIREKIPGLTEENISEMGIQGVIDYETSFLSEDDKTKLSQIANEITNEKGLVIREITQELSNVVLPEQSSVKFTVNECDGIVTGNVITMNYVFARIPVSCLNALKQNDKVLGVYEDQKNEMQLDVSVPTIGASTWWDAGYKGIGKSIAVIDCGINKTHPNLDVNYERIFHDTARTDPDYNDNSNNPDDLNGHGTHIAGIIGSNHSTYKGVVYDIGKSHPSHGLWNLKAAYFSTDGDCHAYQSDVMEAVEDALVWNESSPRCYHDPSKPYDPWCPWADVISFSYGGDISTDDDPYARFMDAAVDTFVTVIVVSAGNDGPTSRTITNPGIAYNVITVGNLDDKNTLNPGDDTIRSSSSRGPTWGGRVKPDIVAPGTLIRSTNNDWQGSNPDFVDMTGTSMAAPHVSGSAALLADYFSLWGWLVVSPLAIKALLLNSANNTGIYADNKSYGWGVLDLKNAFAQREIASRQYVSEGGYLIFTSTFNPGDKCTITWNRHAEWNNSNYPEQYYSLNNLDLYMYNQDDNSLIDYSNSTVDNVEQVQSPITANVAIKIDAKTTDFSHGENEEFFGDAESTWTGVSYTNLPDRVDISQEITRLSKEEFQVKTVVNNWYHVDIHNVQVTLNLPAGLSIVSGSNPQSLGRIAHGSIETAVWTIAGTCDQTYNNIYSCYSSDSYDEQFSECTPGASLTVECHKCGDIITTDTKLYQNIEDCPGDGLAIGADGITLDCDGFTIDGDDSGWDVGINVSNENSITIKNCVITDFFQAGVHIFYSSYNTLFNNKIYSNSNAVWLFSSSHNIFYNNNISDNGYYGFFVDNYVYNSSFYDNNISGSRYGVLLAGTANNSFYNNNIFNNTVWDIEFASSNNNSFYNNNVSSSFYGILVGNSFYNVFSDNDISWSNMGFEIGGDAGSNYITGNKFTNNNYSVYFTGGSTNVLWNNKFVSRFKYNAWEDAGVSGNLWDNDIVGNDWSDFASNPGYPDHYDIDGPGNGVDHYPIGGSATTSTTTTTTTSTTTTPPTTTTTPSGAVGGRGGGCGGAFPFLGCRLK